MKFLYIILLAAFCFNLNLNAQKKTNVKSLKKVNDNEIKVYMFSEVWVWEYNNGAEQGEMAIYRDPKSGHWLFTKEAFGGTDEMTIWFIGKPDGSYISAYQDAETSSKPKLSYHSTDFPDIKTIPRYWKAQKKSKQFGDINMGFPPYTATAHQRNYEGSTDKTLAYLCKTNINFQAIYQFNYLNIDAKLPIYFPSQLPNNILVADESTTMPYGNYTYTLKYVSHTEYHIDLSDYQ